MIENCYGYQHNTDCDQCEQFKECIKDNEENICDCVCELCQFKGEIIKGKDHLYGNEYYTCNLGLNEEEIKEVSL
jgi:hypothetical protein